MSSTNLGDAYLDVLDAQRVKHNIIRRLERLGYDATILPAATYLRAASRCMPAFTT